MGSNPISVSQAALLLTSWTPPSNIDRKPNTMWLVVAVENARDAGAPYRLLPTCPGPNSQKKFLNALKRLWWCCVIRDRIMSLGLRRGMQITRYDFDIDRYPRLSVDDLADEIPFSRVYTPDMKRDLIEILIRLVDFCVILTDVLEALFPLAPPSTQDTLTDTAFRSCNAALDEWEVEERDWQRQRRSSASRCDSVILYHNLMVSDVLPIFVTSLADPAG